MGRLTPTCALAACIGLSACAPATRQQLLVQQAAEFHRDLRWKRISNAAVRVAPWKQSEFAKAYRDKHETLQIEDFELESLRFPVPGEDGYAEEPTTATLVVHRYQVESPEVTRRKITNDEKWLYHGDGWFILDGF